MRELLNADDYSRTLEITGPSRVAAVRHIATNQATFEASKAFMETFKRNQGGLTVYIRAAVNRKRRAFAGASG
jgi:hypothetical protein